jgi:hypothetical protein
MEGKIYRWKEYFEEIFNTPTPPAEKETAGKTSKDLPITLDPLRREKLLM